MLKGIDISSHQGKDIDFVKVIDDGYDFVIIKLTGGVSYVNEDFAAQLAGALAAVGKDKRKLGIGIYHYDGEPSMGGGTAREEARKFLDNLPDNLPDHCLLALDAEERGTRDPKRYEEWLALVQESTGIRPLFYSFPSFIKELGTKPWKELAAKYDLWLASYDDPPLKTVAPWKKAVIVQTSGGSAVPGIASPTDLNEFAEDLDGDGDSDRDDLALLGQPTEGLHAEFAVAKAQPVIVTGYINAQGEPCIDINFRGQAKRIFGYVVVDAGISVLGADDGDYHRSIRVGEDLPWLRTP